MSGPKAGRPGRNVLLRAILVANAVVIASFPGAVVLGGYVPNLPLVAGYGVYLTTDLGVVLGIASAALVAAAIALRLGGGLATRLLGGTIALIVAGVIVAGGALWVTAASNQAAYAPIQVDRADDGQRGPDRRVVFATVDGTELHADLWLPHLPANATHTPTPAMVFIHGGGFVSGELGSRPWLFRAVTDAGYAVIDVEYRLAPPPRWHDAPADVLCALAWVGSQARTLSIDTGRVVVAGDSAGASLALVAGYAAGTAKIDPSCSGVPVVPAGIVAIEPAAELEGIWQDETNAGRVPPFPELYTGGNPVEFSDRYERASPYWLIHPSVPPTLIVTGANDHLVRVHRVQSIADALAQAKARYKLIIIPFADHSLDGTATSAGSQLLEALLPRFLGNPTSAIGG